MEGGDTSTSSKASIVSVSVSGTRLKVSDVPLMIISVSAFKLFAYVSVKGSVGSNVNTS